MTPNVMHEFGGGLQSGDLPAGDRGHVGRGGREAARSALASPDSEAIPARRRARPQATANWLPPLQRLKRQAFKKGKA